METDFMSRFKKVEVQIQLKLIGGIFAYLADERPGTEKTVIDIMLRSFRKSRHNGKDSLFPLEWMRDRFLHDMTLTPGDVAREYMGRYRIKSTMLRYYARLASKVKKAIALTSKRRAACGKPPLEPIKKKRSFLLPSTEEISHGHELPNAVSENGAGTISPSYRETYRADSRYDVGDILKLLKSYRRYIGKDPLEQTIESFIHKLYDAGDCSSILPPVRIDKESTEVSKFRGLHSLLTEVSLVDHAYNVLSHALSILAGHGSTAMDSYASDVVLVSLAHDLGVDPNVRERNRMTNFDHTIVSAKVLEDELSHTGLPKEIKDHLIAAVKNHHLYTSRHEEHLVAQVLREADLRARTAEVSALNPDLHNLPWDEWFDTKALLALIEPGINVLRGRTIDKAVTHGTTVYCTPNFLLACTKKLAEAKNVFDMSFVRESERKRVLLKIVESLREAEVIKGELDSHSFGAHYRIETKTFGTPFDNKVVFFTPLCLEKFDCEFPKIERRKMGTYLNAIEDLKKTIKYKE